MRDLHRRRLAWFLVFGIGFSLGCREAKKTPPGARAAGAAADAGASATMLALPETPSPLPAEPAPPHPWAGGDPVVALKRFAHVLPVRVRAVAVVPADVLRQAVRDVAAAIAYPLSLQEPEEIATRIKALYGVDLARPGPWCVFAWLEMDGPVLVCEGMGPQDALKPLPGSAGWNAWDFHGHRVAKADVIAAAGAGFLAIGFEPAVRRVAMVQGGAWPPLQSGMARVEAEIRRTGRGGQDADVSLWFLDPWAAPWCLSGLCEATAVFASRKGLRVVAEARPGLGLAVKSTIEVLWQSAVAQPFKARPLPDAVSKPADLLVLQAVVEMRDPLVTLRAAPGDPVFLAAALYPDLVLRLLGPPE